MNDGTFRWHFCVVDHRAVLLHDTEVDGEPVEMDQK
jgi:hypothetical protein